MNAQEKLDEDMRDRARALLSKAGLTSATVASLENLWNYFGAPASKGHHLAVPGGLVRHSVNMTERLVDLTEKLAVKWPRPESPYLVGMLHDFCKVEQYRVDDTEMQAERIPGPPKYKYIPTIYGGHGAASAMFVMSNLGVYLNPAEAAAIRWHMGAFGLAGDELKEYDCALDRFPLELIATHTADMLAARVDERGL